MTDPCPFCVTPAAWKTQRRRRAQARSNVVQMRATPRPADHEVCLDHRELLESYDQIVEHNRWVWGMDTADGRKVAVKPHPGRGKVAPQETALL